MFAPSSYGSPLVHPDLTLLYKSMGYCNFGRMVPLLQKVTRSADTGAACAGSLEADGVRPLGEKYSPCSWKKILDWMPSKMNPHWTLPNTP
eukprot:858467-Amphidinium_carterae.1